MKSAYYNKFIYSYSGIAWLIMQYMRHTHIVMHAYSSCIIEFSTRHFIINSQLVKAEPPLSRLKVVFIWKTDSVQSKS